MCNFKTYVAQKHTYDIDHKNVKNSGLILWKSNGLISGNNYWKARITVDHKNGNGFTCDISKGTNFWKPYKHHKIT